MTGAELVLPAERVNRYAGAARAAATVHAYTHDFDRFVKWCESRGYPALPAAPFAVALYLSELADLGKAPATLARRLAAISQAHGVAGFESPRADRLVREVVKGIRRRLVDLRSRGKAPLLVGELRRVSEAIPNWAIGLRDRAILVFGFAGAFRRSELVALDIADLVLTDDGYRVTLRRSKTDQEGKGRTIGVPYGSDPLTCPVRTVGAWLEASGLEAGRLFRSVDAHGRFGDSLSAGAVAKIVKARVAAVGLDARTFAGHSLRSGFCTTAARAGKNPRAIAGQTGHRSLEMVLRYVREAKIFEDNAAMGIGL